MRKAIKLASVALLVAAVGCGREEAKESAGIRRPERDLTLQTPGPAVVTVASPIELGRPAAQSPRATKRAPRHARTTPTARPSVTPEVAPVSEPVTEPAPGSVPELAAGPVTEAIASAGAGRELAPGETVTILPAAAGPSSSDGGDELDLPVEPAHRGIFIGRGGGTCRPRGGVGGFRISLR
jgi:hypothetical protein